MGKDAPLMFSANVLDSLAAYAVFKGNQLIYDAEIDPPDLPDAFNSFTCLVSAEASRLHSLGADPGYFTQPEKYLLEYNGSIRQLDEGFKLIKEGFIRLRKDRILARRGYQNR